MKQITSPLQHNIYRALPAPLYAESQPEAAQQPGMLALNVGLIKTWGLATDWFESPDGLEALAGRGNTRDMPIAMAYSGHQFGQWVPLLGDGRAHMLGQIQSAEDGLFDVQLKGSGRTRFSRGGDGRATLGSVLREYLVSEAMAGLGIATTRSLAVISTGAHVMRSVPEPGAILVRTAKSHLRVGSFQYASSALTADDVQRLADFTVEHYFPDCLQAPNPYRALLDEVIRRHAHLVAQWMLAGFIHGVMNTDNLSIVGETIDFGPCAFLDEFHPRKVFSSIDRLGRYAWNQQASMSLWGLSQFAQSLLPLLEGDDNDAQAHAQEALSGFEPVFHEAFLSGFSRKIGVQFAPERIGELMQSTFDLMTDQSLDFTVFFDTLTRAVETGHDDAVAALIGTDADAVEWRAHWDKARSAYPIDHQTMRRANPVRIARNHRVEQAIEAAVSRQDLKPFERLCEALRHPFEVIEQYADLERPPRPEERVQHTFCGT